MNEEWSNNDGQESGLPLPDVNKAWQKMEALLDEDGRRRGTVPWWFWRTTALGLLLLGGWLWLRSTGKEEKSAKAVGIKKEASQTAGIQKPSAATRTNGSTTADENGTVRKRSASSRENTVVNPKTSTANGPVPLQKSIEQPTTAVVVHTREKKWRRRQPYKEKPAKTAVASLPLLKPPAAKAVEQANAAKKKEAAVELNAVPEKKDSLRQVIAAKKDSAGKADSVKALPAPPVVQTENKTKTKEKFVFSAGIGLQQAIALQGHPSAPTDTLRRKRTFFDYFPSVYVKAERGRWAVQAEFQYSVPQPVAALPFSQKTTYDATAATSSVERHTLQKLYYHQLPVSVNYRLLPQWSVGAGGVYNIFSGAVTQKEVISKYALTGAEAVSRNTGAIKGYTDSFFYKTTAGILLQTDYHWKRFSLGLRYTQNLQPFIRYTRPDGTVLDKKNNALQAMLRFRLWQEFR